MTNKHTNLPTAVDRIAQISAYQNSNGSPIQSLKLDSNEGKSPDPDIASVLIPLAESWNRYPNASRLEARLASMHEVAKEQVMITAGVDEALDRLCRAYLEPGRNAICHWPSFAMIPRYVSLAGGSLRRISWTRGLCPLPEYAEAHDKNTSLTFLVSPNNPTGLAVRCQDIRDLARSCPKSLLILDQAYAEFDDVDLSQTILAQPCGVLLRSFSKAWGLAGLRVGYAIGPGAVIACLRKAGGPYSVSTPSLALVESCLDRRSAWLNRSIPRVHHERSALSRQLRTHGFDAQDSRANFVLARGKAVAWLHSGLAAMGITVRIFPHDEELRDCLRITCPALESDFATLTQAIDICMDPQAILFDLDGVIADVSKSYRRAIQLTARHWGVVLTNAQISTAKTEANSNNDWLLTHSLICKAGASATIDEVTERFEHIYQGSNKTPGLRSTERLAISTQLLQQLAAEMPLAVVTGRPRKDAERFLAEHEILDKFAAIVCMEDGPAKPDPNLVLKAMSMVEVNRAWLLGDAPDDMVAARKAGVLPIGVIAPGSDSHSNRLALSRAGAATVLDASDDLITVMP